MAGAQGFEPHLPDSEFVIRPFLGVAWCLFSPPLWRHSIVAVSLCRIVSIPVVVVGGRSMPDKIRHLVQ